MPRGCRAGRQGHSPRIGAVSHVEHTSAADVVWTFPDRGSLIQIANPENDLALREAPTDAGQLGLCVVAAGQWIRATLVSAAVVTRAQVSRV